MVALGPIGLDTIYLPRFIQDFAHFSINRADPLFVAETTAEYGPQAAIGAFK